MQTAEPSVALVALVNGASKPPATKCYYAIRRCDSLQAPAIFSSWDDCSFYIDQSENDEFVEYKKCTTVQEAASYIEATPSANERKRAAEVTVANERKRAADVLVASVCGEESASHKRLKKAEKKYEDCLQLLKEYNELHGTCDIPGNHSSIQGNKFEKLDKWIVVMRKQIKLFQQDQESTLNQHKVDQLLELGFVMKPTRAKEERRRASLESTWDAMLLQLKEFVKQNGHARVPETRHSNPLFRWTLKLREEYARMKRNQDSMLTRERMDQLAGLGFDMAPPRKRKPFEERAHEWLEFRTKHGREPKRETSEEPLAVWATKTRMKYELYQKGEKTNLTKEQVELLTRWGFKWQMESKFAPVTRTAEYKSWDERLQELELFKEQRGHLLVPQSYPGLGHWVKRQRKEYQKLKKNVKSRLTEPKLKKLQQIGFVFEVRKARASPVLAQPVVPTAARVLESDSESEDERKQPALHPRRGYAPSPHCRHAAFTKQHHVASMVASLRNNSHGRH